MRGLFKHELRALISDTFLKNQSKNDKIKSIFNKPTLYQANDLDVHKKECFDTVNKLIARIHGKSFNTLKYFDALSNTICKVADLCEFLRNNHSNPDWVGKANEVFIELNEHVEKLNTNSDLYRALTDFYANYGTSLDKIDSYTAKAFLFDFEQSCINLDLVNRNKFVSLQNQQLDIANKLTNLFSATHILSNNKFDPEIKSYLDFSTDTNLQYLNTSMNDIDTRTVRKKLYKTLSNSTSLTDISLLDLLNTRYKMADCAGFSSFANRALQGTLAKTPQNITKYLEKITCDIQPYLNEDIKKLKFNANIPQNMALTPWDLTYYTAKKSEDSNQIKAFTKLSAYFSLPIVLNALSDITYRLLGLILKVESVKDEQLWASDGILKLGFYKPANGFDNPNINESSLQGHVYLDLFHRPDKCPLDCHFTIQGGCELLQEDIVSSIKSSRPKIYQNPIIVISMNMIPPTHAKSNLFSDQPICFSLVELEALFHEFGHALHSIVGRTRYQHVTGTRCPTDFAEIPSNIFELYASDPTILKLYGKHFKTQEPIPDEMLDSLTITTTKENNFIQKRRIISTKPVTYPALELRHQILLADLDLSLHSVESELSMNMFNGLVQQIVDRHSYETLTLFNTKDTDRENGFMYLRRFHHLLGYGSKYYSYLLAQSIALEFWDKFSEGPSSENLGVKASEIGPLGLLMGTKFYELLKHGGQQSPQDILSGIGLLNIENGKKSSGSNDKSSNISQFGSALIQNLSLQY